MCLCLECSSPRQLVDLFLCFFVRLLVCLPACLPVWLSVRLSHCVLACPPACLLARSLAGLIARVVALLGFGCWLVCLLPCVLAHGSGVALLAPCPLAPKLWLLYSKVDTTQDFPFQGSQPSGSCQSWGQRERCFVDIMFCWCPLCSRQAFRAHRRHWLCSCPCCCACKCDTTWLEEGQGTAPAATSLVLHILPVGSFDTMCFSRLLKDTVAQTCCRLELGASFSEEQAGDIRWVTSAWDCRVCTPAAFQSKDLSFSLCLSFSLSIASLSLSLSLSLSIAHSTPLHSAPLHSTPLHSTPLHSTSLTRSFWNVANVL